MGAMAIYHLNVQIISRGQGRSCVAAAAYRAGVRLEDERQGLTHDYTRRQDVRETWIQMPEEVPTWIADRQTLWTAIDAAEKRKDAQTAREVNVALPRELTPAQQRDAVQKFVQAAFVERGMVADVALHEGHNPHDPNPHAHILLTTRTITAEGWGAKNRDWNAKDLLVNWRTQWEITCNEALIDAGQSVQIDARSLANQGLDRLPTVHEGVAVRQMERRGIATERGNWNRAIREHQTLVVDLQTVRAERKAIKQYQQRSAREAAWRHEAGWSMAQREWVGAQEDQVGRVWTKADVQVRLDQLRADPHWVALDQAQTEWRKAVQRLKKSEGRWGKDRYRMEQAGYARTKLIREYGGWRGSWARWRGDTTYHHLQETVQVGNRAAIRNTRRETVIRLRNNQVHQRSQAIEAAREAVQPVQAGMRFLEAILRQPWTHEELQIAQQQEAARQRLRQQAQETEWER